VPGAQHSAGARGQQPLGVCHGVSVPAQLTLEQLDPSQRLAETGLVPDEFVVDDEKILAQPQIFLDQRTAALRVIRVMRVALVRRSLFVDALTATELCVLHAGRD
jgi:hypothetical protein